MRRVECVPCQGFFFAYPDQTSEPATCLSIQAGADSVTVIFTYASNQPPILKWLDPATQTFTLVQANMVVDAVAHTITVVSDDTSSPRRTQLAG